MSRAIDRKAITDSFFRGKAEPNFSLASPLSWIYDANVPKFDYDVDRAKQLLDEAGWLPGPDGVRQKDGLRLDFKLNLSTRTKGWATAVQPFLKNVGIQYQLDVVEFGTWILAAQSGPARRLIRWLRQLWP